MLRRASFFFFSYRVGAYACGSCHHIPSDRFSVVPPCLVPQTPFAPVDIRDGKGRAWVDPACCRGFLPSVPAVPQRGRAWGERSRGATHVVAGPVAGGTSLLAFALFRALLSLSLSRTPSRFSPEPLHTYCAFFRSIPRPVFHRNGGCMPTCFFSSAPRVPHFTGTLACLFCFFCRSVSRPVNSAG